VDKRTDIWAFGCVLYALLTGQRPFQSPDRKGGGTLADIISAVLNNEPDWSALPAETPTTIRTLLRRCLQKDANRRLHDIADARIEVEEALTAPTNLEATAAGVPVTPPAAIPRRSRALAGLGVGIGFVALLIGVFLLSRSADRPPPRFQQITFGHGIITGARFAADGQSVIYGAGWGGNAPELYTTHPGSPESRSLALPNSGIWSVSPSGEMAIAVGCRPNWTQCIGTLALAPPAGGAPREILENVHDADWAPDGKTLAVAQFAGGKDRLQYPIGKVLYETAGWVNYVRVSPKGDRIAFLDYPILGQIAGSVSVLDLTGKKTTLSSGWKGLNGLAWSATGEEIWFTASAVAAIPHSLRAVSLSGREREIFQSPGNLILADISRDGRQVLLRHGRPRAVMVGLAPGEQKERDLSWFEYSTTADLSADGRTVLFYEWGEAVRGNLTAYLRRTDGSDAVRLGEGKPLALSPDGKWALALQQTSPPQLVLLPTGPGEQKLLPRGAIREFFDWAAWSPDTGRIFFAAEEPGHRRRTYVQDIAGGPPQPVTPEGMVGTLLSPDGKLIAGGGRYGEYYLCPVGGGEPQPLEGYADGDALLQWSGDGRSLFVRAAGEMELNIFRLDLESGRRDFWKELTPPQPAGVVGVATGPGQVRLTPDGKSYVYTYWAAPNEISLAEGLR